MEHFNNQPNNQTYLNAIIDTNDFATIVCDSDGQLICINEAAKKIFQNKFIELESYQWCNNFLDEKSFLKMKKEEIPIFKTLASKKIAYSKIAIASSSAKNIFTAHSKPLFEGEKLIGVIMTIRQLGSTENKESELINRVQSLEESIVNKKAALENNHDEISRSNIKIYSLFEQSPFSIQIVSKNGRIKFVNKMWQKLWNLDDKEKNILLQNYNIFKDKTIRSSGHLDYINRAFSGEIVEIPTVFYEPCKLGFPGRSRWIEPILYPIKNLEGTSIEEIIILHKDVTEKKEADTLRDNLMSELSFEQNRINTIVQQIPAGLAVLNLKDNKIVLANQKFKEITLIDSDSSELPYIFSDFTNTSVSIFAKEIEYKKNDGSISNLSVSSSPIKNTEGTTSSAVIICKDITLKKYDEKLQQFIATLTDNLLSTINYDQILEQVAVGALPFFADGCAIDILEEGKITRLITRHTNPKNEAICREIQINYPLTLQSPQPSVRVMLSGNSELVEKVDASYVRASSINENHSNLILKMGLLTGRKFPYQYQDYIYMASLSQSGAQVSGTGALKPKL